MGLARRWEFKPFTEFEKIHTKDYSLGAQVLDQGCRLCRWATGA